MPDPDTVTRSDSRLRLDEDHRDRLVRERRLGIG